MNIKLEIFADNPAELMDALARLSAGTAVAALSASAGEAAPADANKAPAPEAVAEPKTNVVEMPARKPAISKSKKAEPEAKPEPETKAEPQPQPQPEPPAGEGVELTLELLKKYAVKLANHCADGDDIEDKQAAAKAVYESILERFGVTKFTDVKEPIGDIYDFLVELRAKKGLPPLDIATLA